MKATIKRIAEEAHVSVTTVSLILNGKGERFSETTRDLVLETARSLHYTPNKLSASLITGRSYTLGLIIPDIRNPFFSALAKGMDEHARLNGYHLILSNSSDSSDRETEILSHLQSYQVDGILFCIAGDTNPSTFSNTYLHLEHSGIPYVFIDRHFSQQEKLNIVTLDHSLGGYLATQHLLELGHQKIACISGPQFLNDSFSRVNGYRKALEEQSLPFLQNWLYEGNYHPRSGYERTLQILHDHPDCTAIFACNDLMALGALKALQDQGISVPKQLSLVGYDDIFHSDLPGYQLTTIRQPVEALGQHAIDFLLKKLQPDTSKFSTLPLNPELIIRATTAAPLQNSQSC